MAQLIASARMIRSWKRFNKRIAVNGRPLLKALPSFPGAVLVAGCQRSGTTALTRIIANAQGFCTFSITPDDELDAALILSEEVQFAATARVCFQTTYLNDSYREYISTPADFRLIWVIRNPFSVVYSMVYHWRTYALDDLYSRCGIDAARMARSSRDDKPVPLSSLSKLEKACYAYVGKSLQLDVLANSIQPDRLLIIDYDQLCRDPTGSLANVFGFINEPFLEGYAQRIHAKSINKESLLTESERALISRHCLDAYQRSLRLISGQAIS